GDPWAPLDLARESGVRLAGASDHHVSEAIYLADPEGNGIEVYVDRPRTTWTDATGGISMTTEALDLNALARAAGGVWTGAPAGMVIGHVHLQVGNVAEADAFYATKLGFPITARYPGASFYGAGGYHHHLAANIWNSRGAGPRSPTTGLDLIELRLDADQAARLAQTFGGASVVADPWGTKIALTQKLDGGQ
ncbi:MAG: VOC family protein, partial [Rhodobacteraceae bacterium]|nr:VOC family protein [Paracoccaceae bacterium]